MNWSRDLTPSVRFAAGELSRCTRRKRQYQRVVDIFRGEEERHASVRIAKPKDIAKNVKRDIARERFQCQAAVSASESGTASVVL